VTGLVQDMEKAFKVRVEDAAGNWNLATLGAPG
jgi:hypothetical protein